MEKIFYADIETPMGPIWVAKSQKGIIRLNLPWKEDKFLKNLKTQINHDPEYRPSKLDEVNFWLDKYFNGNKNSYTGPLDMRGTPFQKKVWRAIHKIPYGKLCSYGQIANKIRNPKASRAVGNAVGQNPINIIIPCHRIIKTDGGLGGFGSGLDKKRYLLDIEGILPDNKKGAEKKVDLRTFF